MKYKNLVRVFASLMACVMLSTGCASDKKASTTYEPLEPEQSNAFSFDFIGGKDVMPIGGYVGPYAHIYSFDGNMFPDFNTDEYYQMIAESGVNLIAYSFTDYQTNPEFVKKALELSEKYGLGMLVNDKRITDKKQDETVTADDLASAISDYMDSPAFCGVYLVDEPRTLYFEPGDGKKLVSDYGTLSQALQQELDLCAYTNLLPLFDYSDKGKESYVRYVEEFCETLQPKMLCFDCYIFDEYRWGTEDIYFWMLDVIYQAAEKRDIPVWTFIQAGSQWTDDGKELTPDKPYYPNEAQFNWNVNVSLAYGVQGIQYFPMMQPIQYTYGENGTWNFEHNGMIGLIGNKTQWYNYAQNINKQIAVMDEILMNAVNKGIIVSGDQAKKELRLTTRIIESGSFQELQSVDGDAMVGCFNYNGQTALYVVNYSTEYAQHITLSFDGQQNLRMIQGTETSYVKAENLKLDMAAGEGILLVVE